VIFEVLDFGGFGKNSDGALKIGATLQNSFPEPG
jgi:hypothetical protein